MSAAESTLSLLEDEFSSLVVRQLELLHGLETSNPSLCMDLKQVTQAMYSVFIQSVNKLSDKSLSLVKAEANLFHFQKDAEEGMRFKRKFEEDLKDRVFHLEALQMQCQRPIDAGVVKELHSELKAIHQQLDDNATWHTKHLNISQQLMDARDELEELKRLYRLGSHRNISLRKELTGRIQQIQFMRKGLDKDDNPAYVKLLTEMAQNTMEAVAQSDAYAKQEEEEKSSSREEGALESQGRESSFPTPNRNGHILHPKQSSSPTAHMQFQDISPDNDGFMKRIVKLSRSEGAGYGFTLQGGAVDDLAEGEHDPVTIVDMYAGMPAQQSGQLFIGDRILSVNGLSVDLLTHSQIVNICRESKECVVLEVLSKHPLEKVPSDVTRLRGETDGPLRMAHDLNLEGNRAMLEHKWSEALQLYSRAIEIAPTSALYWRNKASAYSELNMLVDAKACCEMSLSYEKDAKTFFQLCIIATKMGDRKAAIEAMRQAVELEPQNQHYARKLAELEEDKRREGSVSSADNSVVEYSFRAPRGSQESDAPKADIPHYSPFTGLQVSVATAQVPDSEEAVFSSMY